MMTPAAMAVTSLPGMGGIPWDALGGEWVNMSQIAQQTYKRLVPMLSPEQLAEARGRWRTFMSDDPMEHEKPSDQQLTALAFLVGAGKAPYVDFGVGLLSNAGSSKLSSS